jgi:hypothetical protein
MLRTRLLLVFLVLLIAGVALSQPTEKKQEDKKAISAQTESNDNKSLAAAPFVINVTGGTQSVEDACKSTNCNKEPEQSWWHRLWFDPIATFTAALFLATAALIGTGVIQWRETRNVAKKQLRAYLGATQQDVRFVAANHLQTYIDIANTGHTPARNVRQWTRMEIRDRNDSQPFPLPEPGQGKRPIVPGAKWPIGLERIVTGEELAQLDSQEKTIFVWGRVEYLDTFGESQWLNFRYRNRAVVFATTGEGVRQFIGWALLPEEDGNDAS